MSEAKSRETREAIGQAVAKTPDEATQAHKQCVGWWPWTAKLGAFTWPHLALGYPNIHHLPEAIDQCKTQFGPYHQVESATLSCQSIEFETWQEVSSWA